MSENTEPEDHLEDSPEEGTPPTTGVDQQKLAEEAARRRKELPLLQRIVKHFSKDRNTYRELVINAETLEKRVALLTNGVLDKFEIEHKGENRMVGAIFKGRVQNLESGLKAAFVDIGQPKNAFLHYWDIVPNQFDSGVEIVDRPTKKRDRPKITQKDIAKALAVKLQVYADWENGKAIPSTAAIGKLEQVLGVKLPGPGTPSAVKKLANEKRIAAAGAKKSGVGKSSVGKAVLVERKGVATSMNSKV